MNILKIQLMISADLRPGPEFPDRASWQMKGEAAVESRFHSFSSVPALGYSISPAESLRHSESYQPQARLWVTGVTLP